MDKEVEKLFMEADNHKRGKLSTQQLDTMFRRIGITLTIKEIRALIFQYDKTKSKDLDLEEFRQLIHGIIAANEI